MPNILDEYLIKLGTTVDATGMRRFEQALRQAGGAVDMTVGSMAKAMFKAQTEIVGGFVAIGGAALGLIDKVAMADQEYRLFALHMFMSKDAARSLKVAMDALGQPLENLWWDRELAQRTHQLIEDQRRMAPDGDFNAQMRKIRDIRFEFTRMEVELKYLGMHVVQDFMKALGLGPDELLHKLRVVNDWVIKNMPRISQMLVHDFMPIWHDIKDVLYATGDAIKNAFILFTNLVGLLTGDTGIEGTTFSIEKLSKAIHHVAGGLAEFAELMAHTEAMLAHFASAAALGLSGKWAEAGKELKAGADSITTKEGMEILGGGFGMAFGGPLGAVAGAGAAHEFGGVLEQHLPNVEHTIGQAHDAAAGTYDPDRSEPDSNGTARQPSSMLRLPQAVPVQQPNTIFRIPQATTVQTPSRSSDRALIDTLNRLMGVQELAPTQNVVPPEYLSMGVSMDQLTRAVIGRESAGDTTAVSGKGAVGLMQLMPNTAKDLGVDPKDPKQNVEGGTRYLKQLLNQYDENLAYALAAYNFGPGNFDKFLAGQATLPAETRNYVSNILHDLGKHGDVKIGSVVIHIKDTNANPQQIQRAVADGMQEVVGKRTQRNLAEFQDLQWSY